MAKGLYTQGMCVLLREPVGVAELKERLKEFQFVGIHESTEDDDAPVTLVYAFRPEVNGHLLVTPAKGCWPDEMGDPDESPERFVAWSIGQFGPLAYPGCLQRAGEQSWGWEEGGERIQQHAAHVRLLISYVLGVEESDDEDEVPLVPDDYDPLDELNFLTRAVAAVLEMPEAICYFNPGGEVLRDDGGLRRGLNHAWSHDLPPLDMWTNIRLFRATDGWTLMDTVGNGQFDLPDLEAIYHNEDYQPSEVEGFLRSASLYLLQGNDEVEDGDTADGPGNLHWSAMQCADALSDPPRPTIRWIPQDGSTPPEDLLDRGSISEADDDETWADEAWADEEEAFDENDDLDEELP
jgi:hypothetical protein